MLIAVIVDDAVLAWKTVEDEAIVSGEQDKHPPGKPSRFVAGAAALPFPNGPGLGIAGRF